ncbi:HAD family hydrolase [Nocardioides aurantiacus]|uniref:HAD superfamily hydrolase (TIGR01509 family)/HAD superfamily hydrolase (TIGR01549 family) n=1 Tax=Nocardioides aurantiacus TaxID=86796 RepID=A0A3N2CZL4_9ACTN|nr:HAD family hydrolase [Nocardioides aurantiacus]ROR92977.1 HAD superfamily hydrolase (TIGR01509 family)/HAD superfamily hydrolase (TIGR01549 family) [Nocardioides aurantiacus]
MFDVDGTLVDSTYHHAVAWQRAFDRHELHFPLWRIHPTVGMGGDKLVGEVAGDAVEERLGDDLREAWQEEYAELEAEVDPLPGARDLVRALAADGWRVALASSGEPQFAEKALASLGVRDDVAVLVTNDDVEASKPEPDLLEVTLSRLGVARAVMVGDTPYDVQAATAAGLACVALRSGGFGEAELTEAGAVHVAGTPADLLDLDWEQHLRPVAPSGPTPSRSPR